MIFFKPKLLFTDTVGQSSHNLQIKKCQQLPNSNIGGINNQDDFLKCRRKQERIHDIKTTDLFRQRFRLKSVFNQCCLHQHLLDTYTRVFRCTGRPACCLPL